MAGHLNGSPGKLNGSPLSTGWRRLIKSPQFQILFHKRAIKYRSLLQEMTYEDKGSYEASSPCSSPLNSPPFNFPVPTFGNPLHRGGFLRSTCVCVWVLCVCVFEEMCGHMCACVYMLECVCVYTCWNGCVCMHSGVFACVWMLECVDMCVCEDMCGHMCACIKYVRVYTCWNVCACINVGIGACV